MNIDKHYIGGFVAALRDFGLCSVDNLANVAEKVAQDLAMSQTAGQQQPPPDAPPPAQTPGAGMGEQASPDELSQVGQAGLSDKDIESAAKVVQVIAEMKRKADIASGVLPPQSAAGGGQASLAGQPPLPSPPQAPQQQPGAPAAQ